MSDKYREYPATIRVPEDDILTQFDDANKRIAELEKRPPANALQCYVSSSPYRLTRPGAAIQTQPVEGSTWHGEVYVFTLPIAGRKRIRFFIDGKLAQVENWQPHDLRGDHPDNENLARPYDSRALTNGQHTLGVEETLDDNTVNNYEYTFMVKNGG